MNTCSQKIQFEHLLLVFITQSHNHLETHNKPDINYPYWILASKKFSIRKLSGDELQYGYCKTVESIGNTTNAFLCVSNMVQI